MCVVFSHREPAAENDNRRRTSVIPLSCPGSTAWCMLDVLCYVTCPRHLMTLVVCRNCCLSLLDASGQWRVETSYLLTYFLTSLSVLMLLVGWQQWHVCFWYVFLSGAGHENSVSTQLHQRLPATRSQRSRFYGMSPSVSDTIFQPVWEY